MKQKLDFFAEGRLNHKQDLIRSQLRSSNCFETAKDATDHPIFDNVYELNLVSFDKVIVQCIHEDEEDPLTRPCWDDGIKKSVAFGAKEWNQFFLLGFDIRDPTSWKRIAPTMNRSWRVDGKFLFYDLFFTTFDERQEIEPAIVLFCYVTPKLPEREPQNFCVLIPARKLIFDMRGIPVADQVK